ncbi:MAG: hypothetical protein AVDCRST_MAG59-2323, partial [uncultured Thermomicrobiales bacterium]
AAGALDRDHRPARMYPGAPGRSPRRDEPAPRSGRGGLGVHPRHRHRAGTDPCLRDNFREKPRVAGRLQRAGGAGSNRSRGGGDACVRCPGHPRLSRPGRTIGRPLPAGRVLPRAAARDRSVPGGDHRRPTHRRRRPRPRRSLRRLASSGRPPPPARCCRPARRRRPHPRSAV